MWSSTQNTLVLLFTHSSWWPVGPDLAKFRHFGKIIKVLGNFKDFIQVFVILWPILYPIGQIFIYVNGQILKNSQAIWSHWWWLTTTLNNPCNYVCHLGPDYKTFSTPEFWSNAPIHTSNPGLVHIFAKTKINVSLFNRHQNSDLRVYAQLEHLEFQYLTIVYVKK